jgi:hypothetical protein
MKKDKTYKLDIETIEDLKKLKKENEVSFDKLFKMLIKLFKKNEKLSK